MTPSPHVNRCSDLATPLSSSSAHAWEPNARRRISRRTSHGVASGEECNARLITSAKTSPTTPILVRFAPRKVCRPFQHLLVPFPPIQLPIVELRKKGYSGVR
jgi:hypothetical protein